MLGIEKFGVVALAACLTIGATGTASSARQQASGSTPSPTPFSDTFIGMHMLSPAKHWPPVPIGSVRPAGISWVAVEPQRGQYVWQGVDYWVAQAQAHGAQLDYEFLNVPQWASSRPNEHCTRGNTGCAAPPDMAAWDEFVTAMATRYRGKITSYEIWNEPNAPAYWSGTPAQMVQLAAQAYRIIKSIDPNAIVLTPASASPGWPIPHDIWLDEYLEAGGAKYTDAVAWHGYSGRNDRPALPPEDLVNQIDKVRSVMAKHGLSNLQLWNTEGGWGRDTQLPDPQQQAAFLMRWYLIQFTHGVSRAYWYQWDNPLWGTLWTQESGPTPAGMALGQVYNWLQGVTASTPCAPASGSIWTCDLLKGAQHFRAVWSTAGNASYSGIQGFNAYMDATGKSNNLAGKSVAVGPLPVLLEVR